MTLEEVRAMTPDEKRVGLAELDGWMLNKYSGDHPIWQKGDWTAFTAEELPDYCNDLNAVHEVEKGMLAQSAINKHDTPFHRYHLILHQICELPPDTFNKPMHPEHWAITATADQRTTALILTLSTQR